MKSNIHTNVVVNLIRTVAMTLLSFITFPFVCRVLGDSALGTFSWATSFVYYFIILSKISIPNIAVRECTKVKDDPEKLSMKIQEFFILQAVMTLISFIFMSVLVLSIPALHEGDNQTLIFIISLNFLASVFAFEWVFTALEKHTYLAIRSIVVLGIVDILIFTSVKYKEWLPLYTFLTTLTTLLTVVSNLFYLPQLIKFKKTGPYNFKQYFPVLKVLFFISLAAAVYSKTDSFILGLIDDSKASVGSYSVGMKGVDIIISIILALSSVFMPRASYYLSKNDQKNYANLNKYSANICFIIVVPFIAMMSTLAFPITYLISGGDGYNEAAKVLIALCPLMLTYSLSNIIYTQILVQKNKEKYYLFVMLFGAILNILLSLLFALVFFKESPAFGVALGTTITDAICLMILIAITYEDSKKMIFNWNNLKIILIGIALGVISYFVSKLIYQLTYSLYIDLAYLIEVFGVFVICVILYLTALVLTREKLAISFINRHR